LRLLEAKNPTTRHSKVIAQAVASTSGYDSGSVIIAVINYN